VEHRQEGHRTRVWVGGGKRSLEKRKKGPEFFQECRDLKVVVQRWERKGDSRKGTNILQEKLHGTEKEKKTVGPTPGTTITNSELGPKKDGARRGKENQAKAGS